MMGGTARLLLALATGLLLGPQLAHPEDSSDKQAMGTAPLLSSVFFSVGYGPCLDFSVEDWQTELQLLSAINVSSIILKNVVHGDSDTNRSAFATAAYPSTLPWMARQAGTDVLGKLLTACDMHGGFEVHVGIFEDAAFFHGHKTVEWLSVYSARNVAVMQEVTALYRSRHPSFHSIYDSAEVNDRDWLPPTDDRLIVHYLQPVHGWAHRAGLRTSTAPFFFNSSKPTISAQFWDRLFASVKIDRVYLDDDAASSFWTIEGPIPFYRAVGSVAKKYGVEVWSDCVDHGHDDHSQPIAHFVAQLRAEAPFVQGFTTFEWLRYMSPGKGAYSGSAQLYDDYLVYFQNVTAG